MFSRAFCSTKRTHVVDDESDYYATDSNQWLRPKEREALQHKREELHSMRHASRRDFKVTLDFAGRRVIEERDCIDSHTVSPGDDEVQTDPTPALPNLDDFQSDVANPNLHGPSPKVVETHLLLCILLAIW
jgi:activating signal cointegrator 1